MKLKKSTAILLLLAVCQGWAPALDLALGPDDVLIEQGTGSGYELWIRRKHDIGSVLLTETTKDPEGREANYALRDRIYHPTNGDEKRMLDGNFIDPGRKLYSLIDSTPEPHPRFGEAFHVFVPYLTVYGYPGGRTGLIEIKDDTFINIRTFAHPYADYSGAWRDNPFRLVFTQRPPDAAKGGVVLPETEKAFTEIAREGGGEARTAAGKGDLARQLEAVVAGEPGESLDLALCLDTTFSMADDIDDAKRGLLNLMEDSATRYRKLRIGVVFYKDYFEQYLTKVVPFSTDSAAVGRIISGATALGGRDTPEAVYEALFSALHELKWESAKKIIILVGDAPPHPYPRGTITKEMVIADAAAAGIEIHTIILPQ
ncbi:MAG: VWA domain-containing protein [Spirochaetales bacterium]|nr:VWA domain-containing protein [Spirochaetales bacterium]